MIATGRRIGRWVWRAVRRSLRPSGLVLVYDPGYAVQVAAIPMDPQRAELVLAFLADEGLVRRRELLRPHPVSVRNLRRVHTDAYLESLENREVVEQIVGAPLTEPAAMALVDCQRLAAGGTMLAAATAVRTGAVAVNLGGGFHHAAAGRGMGFCAFNDLALAVARLRAGGFAAPVLIVDLDLHDGNGTRLLFAADPTVHTFTIHNQDWSPREAAAATVIALGTAVGDDRYLSTLREALPPVLRQVRPGLVLYVAGVDPAADDAVGDWAISAGAMLARDQFVIEQVRRAGAEVPLAVVLGGGYGGNAWRYTARFLGWLAAGRAVEPPTNARLLVRRAQELQRQLRDGARELPAASEWTLTPEDVAAFQLGGAPPPRRLLGRYAPQGVELLMERLGILGQVRALGFARPVLDLDFHLEDSDTVRLFGDPARNELLMEIRFRRDRASLPGMEVLFVEWVLLQNPRRAFPSGRHALPGQQHPGLGIFRDVMAWLVVLCSELGLDGLVFKPAGYFVATLGSRFLDPVRQARLEAMRRALGGLRVVDASRAVEEGRVVDVRTGAPVAWEPASMVLPVSDRLRRLVEGDRYEQEVERALAALSYRLRIPGEPDAASGVSRSTRGAG
ncbi:MAG TPA: histone deacetylase [Gemmatimonadales bacterium]|nr:histone deacetylase [Gemmatimonadales bacterium]